MQTVKVEVQSFSKNAVRAKSVHGAESYSLPKFVIFFVQKKLGVLALPPERGDVVGSSKLVGGVEGKALHPWLNLYSINGWADH